MRAPQIERRARKYAPRQYVSDDHSHRRSFAELEIDRRLSRQPFDGKSFRGLRAAWEAARRRK